MWREFSRWCGASPGPAFVEDWTPLRGERAAVATEQDFAGEVVSAARVVGNRRIEAIIADRERRLLEMLARDAR